MKTYALPNGDGIPAFGLGTWKSPGGEVYKAVKEALKVGYRHIDCAPAYGNEVEIGRALSEAPDVKRDDLWVTSKLWNNAHDPERVQPALKQTLRDLKLDYLDLFLIHWPVLFKSDVAFPRTGGDFLPLDAVPTMETWGALEECVKKGLVKHIGVSNFSIKKLEELVVSASIKPVVNQVELHPFLQQPKLFDFCKSNNIYLTAYSPLGSGDRPAHFHRDNDPMLFENPVIKKIADKHGASAGQVLIKWGVQRGTVVIPKTVTPARIKENYDAQTVNLDDEDMRDIAALDKGYRFLDGSVWCMPGSPYTLENIWDE